MKIAVNQQGNTLFIIFITIALFGVLSAAIWNSSLQSNYDLDDDARTISLAKYAQKLGHMRDAILRLKTVNECSDTEISFAYDSDNDGDVDASDDYWNAASSTDCYVFHPDGGQMSFPSLPNNVNDGSEIVITAANQIESAGTTAHELYIIIPKLTLESCNELNARFGASTNADGSPIVEGSNFTTTNKFTGSFGSSGAVNNANGEAEICMQATKVNTVDVTGDEYYFFYTLIIN